MISLNRAEQCIGRPVLVEGERKGDVLRVDHERGHILIRQYESSLVLRVLPEELDWQSSLSDDLRNAILNQENMENAQIGHQIGGDQEYTAISYIYSAAMANDDGCDHLLYVVLWQMERVHIARPTANPWIPYEIEEALGWADA